MTNQAIGESIRDFIGTLVMWMKVLLCLLPVCLAVQSGEQCNILKDKRDMLYHPTAEREVTAESTTDKEGSAETREALLEGLTEFRRYGVPGAIVAVSDDIEVIMSASKLWKILMVAGRYGQGRVVAFSHNGYMAEFKDSPSVLGENCYKWVTKGGFNSSWNIIEWDDRSQLALADVSNTVALLKVAMSEEDPQDALDFVNRGGGLIITTNPWAMGEKKDLYKRYFQKLAVSMGFYFAPYYTTADLENNLASKSHYGRTLDKIVNKPDEVTDEEWGFAKDEIRSFWSTDVIPDSASQKILSIVKANLTWPVSAYPMRYYLIHMSTLYNYGSTNLGKAPALFSTFPYDFVTQPPIVESPEKTLQAKRSMYHSTGYYLPAGCELEVIGSGLEKWYIRVGAGDDDLSNKDKIWRWPQVMVMKELSDTGGTIYSSQGGPVYMWSPDGEYTITYKLKGVVESPQYNISDPESKANWLNNRDKPGLWADFFSDKILITLPSVSVRHLEDPGVMVQFWTTLLEHFDAFKSYGEIPPVWFPPDVQISNGYMHAGYPVGLPSGLANPQSTMFLLHDRMTGKDRCSCWGPYHEIGHNLQENAWKFQGTGEVTNNIFSLYGYTVMQGIPVWDNCWLEMADNTGWKTYLEGGAKFDKDDGMNSPRTQLIIFAQMARDFGWDTYPKVFKLFKDGETPSEWQGRIDNWVRHMSTVTGKNIAPIFDFWGIPVSEDVWKTYANLTVYEPQDKVTEAFPDRMAASITKAATFA